MSAPQTGQASYRVMHAATIAQPAARVPDVPSASTQSAVSAIASRQVASRSGSVIGVLCR